jgi:undecaprenyl-diphosphatase
MIYQSMRRTLLFRSLLFAASAAVIAFLLLTVLHAHLEDPSVHRLDLAVQATVHSWTNPGLTRLMLFLTWAGSIQVFIPTLILALIVLLTIGEKEQGRRLIRKRQTSGIFGVAIGGALLLNEFFKAHFHRARPKLSWTIGHEPTFSYPSGHALFSFVLYGLIAYTVLGRHSPLRRRLPVALAAMTITFGIGLSRIYLGLHWPTDVLAGYITAAVWLSGTIFIDRQWTRQAHRLAHPRKS